MFKEYEGYKYLVDNNQKEFSFMEMWDMENTYFVRVGDGELFLNKNGDIISRVDWAIEGGTLISKNIKSDRFRFANNLDVEKNVGKFKFQNNYSYYAKYIKGQNIKRDEYSIIDIFDIKALKNCYFILNNSQICKVISCISDNLELWNGLEWVSLLKVDGQMINGIYKIATEEELRNVGILK